MIAPPSRVLDLTRSMRRVGHSVTGVDRVERAYLAQFLSMSDAPIFGLVRTSLGYALLDDKGCEELRNRLEGQVAWGAPDLLSRLPRGRSACLRAAEADVRRLAIARCLPQRLHRMLAKAVPRGAQYYNVGHSNLTDRVFNALRGARVGLSVLVHDVIPLEYPEFQRQGTVAPFRNKLRRVRALADEVIYNSADTKRRCEAVFANWGPSPPSIVAHLGTIPPAPAPDDVPPGLPPRRPYFITVGTIEPRKNHALLLDIWEELGPDAPGLLICGSRGWNNETVFRRLDQLPVESPVRECAGLSDGALAALVQDAAGALFPSHAEGFGLPPGEAIAMGTRVLCNDLDVFREFLGEIPVYAAVSDRYLWINTIKRWAQYPEERQVTPKYDLPNWADHFKIVLRLS